MVLQPIHDIAEICAQLGVREAVLSPGSRCAPLTLSFTRHPSIATRIISDERSAGFIAFGMAQKLERPIITVCTSGTALLNFGPAVTEAFYQRAPIVVISADRPPEWVDQQDGQTIRQQNVFGNLVKKSYQLPDQYDHPDVRQHIHRIISEAVNESKEYPAGPVHINVPIREPFYPGDDEKLEYSQNLKAIKLQETEYDLQASLWSELGSEWKEFKRVLIIGGQRNNPPTEQDVQEINQLSTQIPFIGDVISNLHGFENIIRYPDIFLTDQNESYLKKLQPELLVTFGKSVISKNLKLFLRKFSPDEHWHIQPAGPVADTYQSLSKIIRVDESTFIKNAVDWNIHTDIKQFRQAWIENEERAKKLAINFTENFEFGEFKAVSQVIDNLPSKASLHIANSMPVRLVNYVGLRSSNKNIRVVANRGTSGIDGSNGTAVGEAIISDETIVLITGDMAFFYDRNAFWHNHDISNLKIVLLNNHAGGIFGMIEGPKNLPELSEYFETEQPLTAKNTAEDYGFQYYNCKSQSDLDGTLKHFFKNDSGPVILEIETSNELNKSIFKSFKEKIKGEFN